MDDKKQSYAVKHVLRNLRGSPPGPATDDRWAQLNAFTGVVYIAVRAVARSLAAASVDVLAYRPKSRKSLSVGGRIVKAQASSNGQARDEDFAPVKFSHPLNRLFRTINAQDTLGSFLTDWVIQRELTGTTHVWTPRMAGFDKPAELWVLPTPFLNYISPRPDLPVGGYNLLNMTPTGTGFMNYAGGACELDGREVLRHQYKHPLYKWDGYSPVTACGEQLDVLRSIDMARKASMDNEVDPSMLIALKGATPEECQRIAHEFGNRHGGAENRKKVAAFAAEDVAVDMPTRAAKDMDYGSGWDQLFKLGLATFSVLPTIAGVNEAGSYAQLYAARRQFYDQCIKPVAAEIGQFLTKHLAHKFYGDKFVIELNVPPPDNEEMVDKQLDQDSRNGTITVNQYLTMRKRPEVPDGDVPPTIYLAKMQQAVQPPPGPGGMPGAPMPGGDMGAGGGAATPPPNMPTGDEGGDGEGDGSPEDSMVNAILAQLDGDGEPVKKAWVQIANSKSGSIRAQNRETKNIVYGKNAERVLAAQKDQGNADDTVIDEQSQSVDELPDEHLDKEYERLMSKRESADLSPEEDERLAAIKLKNKPRLEESLKAAGMDGEYGVDDKGNPYRKDGTQPKAESGGRQSAPQHDHGKPSTRTYTAGFNRAEVTFPNKTAEVLYDAGAQSAKASRTSGKVNTDRLNAARSMLTKMGVSDPAEQHAVITATHAAVKKQMAGVKDGESRKVDLPDELKAKLGMGTALQTAQERTKQTDAENGYLPLRTPATQQERAAGKKDPADVYHDAEMGRLPRPSTADAAAPDSGTDTGELVPDEYPELTAPVPVAKRIPVAQRLATPENRRVIATALAAPLAKKWSADSKARNFFSSRHWVPAVAAKHADKVAAKLGIPRDKAEKMLGEMLRELAIRVHAQILNGKDVSEATKTGQIRTRDGKRVNVTLGGKGSGGPKPPQPKNAAGKGSLAPRPTKKALMAFGKDFLKRL